jgi:hypothetical protein
MSGEPRLVVRFAAVDALEAVDVPPVFVELPEQFR